MDGIFGVRITYSVINKGQSIYTLITEYEECSRKIFKILNEYNFRMGSQNATQFLASGKEMQSFHIRTMQHLDIIKVLFIHQLMNQ